MVRGYRRGRHIKPATTHLKLGLYAAFACDIVFNGGVVWPMEYVMIVSRKWVERNLGFDPIATPPPEIEL